MSLFNRRLAAPLAALCLAGCASLGTIAPSSPSTAGPTPTVGTVLDLAVNPAVGALELRNQDGRVVTLDSFKGHYVVLTDFLTLCQEICPLASANFGRLQRQLAAAGLTGQVTLLEITVDPQRDTPARLKAYQALFGASPNWDFLTGSPSALATLWGAFGVAYERVGEAAGARTKDWLTGQRLTYDVNHQDVVFVLGPDGHEKWLTVGLPDAAKADMPARMQQFLNASGRSHLSAPESGTWTPADITSALSYFLGRPV